MERLQKYLASCGVASRRKSEEIILAGRVKVNNEVVKELGFKVSHKDDILVDDEPILKEEKVYYLLYKPEKVICSAKDEKGRKTVVDLIDTDERIFPIGRLDYDTSGLLLLTNDGALSEGLAHPRGNIRKTYSAKIEGYLNSKEIYELERGIILDGVKTKRALIRIDKVDKENNKSYVEITISEGRNHQVKNMFAYFNHKVLKLKRVTYAFLHLYGLKKGEYRKLTTKEVKQLYSLIKTK